MKTVKKIQWFVSVTAGVAMLTLSAGCQTASNDSLVHGEQFLPNDAERAMYDFNEMEAANSARADATLRSYHFDGTTLNSLGEERLALMLHNGDMAAPLVAYLDLPTDDSKTEKRKQVVVAFLKDKGLTDDQIELRSGPNPDVNSPVAPILAAQGAGGGAAPVAGPAPASH